MEGSFRSCIIPLLMIVSSIALLIFLISRCSIGAPLVKDDEAVARQAAENAENHRKGLHCLSGWDGSQPDIVEAVKSQLRDPASFEHIETRITPADKEGFHQLMMRFRSRNGFGGMTEGRALGIVNTQSCNGRLTAID